MSSFVFRRFFLPVARSNLGLVLCRNKYKRAMTARFRNVAEGNISRLRDAQAFHAAVKRPPYFMFARSADISPPGTARPACPHPACAVLIYLLVTSAGRRARVGARLIQQRLLYLTAERAA